MLHCISGAATVIWCIIDLHGVHSNAVLFDLQQVHKLKLKELLRWFLLTCASGRPVEECFPSRYVLAELYCGFMYM